MTTPTPSTAQAVPPDLPPAGAPGLAVGITEPNASLLWPPGTRATPHAAELARDGVDAIRPSVYRLVIEWAGVQHERDLAPDWDLAHDGCSRAAPPCAGWAGVREQLRAVRAQQQRARDGRWQVLAVFGGTPRWAARRRAGCERAHLTARSRAPRALDAYRRVIADLARVARQEGVTIRYWSPWNEPNHPFGLSPQRSRCDRGTDTAAAALYGQLTDAMRAALATDVPGEQELVVGEFAGLTRRTEQASTSAEMMQAMPRAALCAGRILSQHGYVGGADPVDAAAAAYRRRCGRDPEVWITETGAGGPRRGARRRRDPTALRDTCERLHARLRRWYADPRVTLAVQYTVREDPVFPTGLVSADLSAAYPALGLWAAWGGKRRPTDPPPASGC